MTFSTWPSHLHRRLTPAQVQMIREGWAKAKADGWTMKEWCQDVGALLGMNHYSLTKVVRRELYVDVE